MVPKNNLEFCAAVCNRVPLQTQIYDLLVANFVESNMIPLKVSDELTFIIDTLSVSN